MRTDVETPDVPEIPEMAAVEDDPAAALRPLGIFRDLPPEEIEELADACGVTTAHPGQVVQAQGVPVRFWHVISSGYAIVHRDWKRIGLLGRGDSWSEHSLLNRLPSPIAVVALSPLTLLTLGERAFFAIPERHPVLAGRLVARSATSADRLALPLFNALTASRCPDNVHGGAIGSHRHPKYH